MVQARETSLFGIIIFFADPKNEVLPTSLFKNTNLIASPCLLFHFKTLLVWLNILMFSVHWVILYALKTITDFEWGKIQVNVTLFYLFMHIYWYKNINKIIFVFSMIENAKRMSHFFVDATFLTFKLLDLFWIKILLGRHWYELI